jgi:hypothetical protein
MAAYLSNGIRIRAFAMARSGEFIDWQAIEASLQSRGDNARVALRDPNIRSHLDSLCQQYYQGKHARSASVRSAIQREGAAAPAALRLSNMESLALDADVERAVDSLAIERNLPRSEVLQTILRDWLNSRGRVPVDTLDKGTETDGLV